MLPLTKEELKKIQKKKMQNYVILVEIDSLKILLLMKIIAKIEIIAIIQVNIEVLHTLVI